MVTRTVYENKIYPSKMSIFDPVEVKQCEFRKGLENKSDLIITNSKIKGLCKSFGTALNVSNSSLQELDANHAISLNGTRVKSIICKEIAANDCEFGSLETGEKAVLCNTKVRHTFTVNVESASKITINLNNSVIHGDLIVLSKRNKTDGGSIILKDYSNGLMSCGQLNLAPGAKIEYIEQSITWALPPEYRSCSFDEVPDSIKMKLAAFGEGEKIGLGQFKCIVKNGRLQLDVPKQQELIFNPDLDPEALTLSILRQRLQGFMTGRQSASSIDFLGGTFEVIKGKICMIKAPPELALIVNPYVEVKINGGVVEGKIRLENCQGSIDHITLNGPNEVLPKPVDLNIQTTNDVPKIAVSEELINELHPAEKSVIIFSDDLEDDDFICPITFELMKNPYRIPTEFRTHAFDYDSLRLICDKNGNFKCPLTSKIYNIENCIPDLAMQSHIEKLLAK